MERILTGYLIFAAVVSCIFNPLAILILVALGGVSDVYDY